MRTATAETRRALREAIAASKLSRNAWARAAGLRPTDVSDALRGASVSLDRENNLRAALDLAALTSRRVELDSTQQVIARAGHGRRRGYLTLRVYVSGEDADRLVAAWRASGADSFSAYIKALHNCDGDRP